MSDIGLFLRQLLLNPVSISAPVPSSKALAREMVRGITASDRVIELGPGTGVFTAALLAAGVTPDRLVLVERQQAFRALLALRYPGITILDDAADLSGSPMQQVDAVVSGLPLLSMPVEVQRGIVSEVFRVLKAGGDYVQFTYGPKPSIAPELLAEMGIAFSKSPRVWANFPPAVVHRYRLRTTGMVDIRSG